MGITMDWAIRKFHALFKNPESYSGCLWLLFRPKESILTTEILGFAGGRINRLIIIIPKQKDRSKLSFQKDESLAHG